MEFKIGDRVYVKEEEDFFGTVTDVMHSNRENCDVYEVFDERTSERGIFKQDELELVSVPIPDHKYRLSAEIDEENKIVFCSIDEFNGYYWDEIARGRGYIKHDGVVGFAQAFSYAAKMVLKAVDKDGIYYKK